MIRRRFRLILGIVVLVVFSMESVGIIHKLLYLRYRTQSMQCESNIRELGLSLIHYHNIYGHFPEVGVYLKDTALSPKWTVALKHMCLKEKRGIFAPLEHLKCPADKTTDYTSYEFNRMLSGVSLKGVPEQIQSAIPLIWEKHHRHTQHGWMMYADGRVGTLKQQFR